MHLGVNLQKAFFDRVKADSSDATHRDNPKADVLVYEFCKLLGKSGVPEYGLGAVAFLYFLQLSRNSSSDPDLVSYYKQCESDKLERQVGNRYFVTAAMAGKILYL